MNRNNENDKGVDVAELQHAQDEEPISDNRQQTLTEKSRSPDETYPDKNSSIKLLSAGEVEDFQSRWHSI